jgi:hypothetical protein
MMKEIAAAFVKAQRNFAPALKKAENPYFGSKYADLAICIEAVIDSLHDNGIAFMQHTFESEKGVIVETVFLHESGESMQAGRIFVPAAQNSPQAFGSALTYARRYSIMTACGIAPEDDDGNDASKLTRPKTQMAPAYDYWTTKHGDVPSYATAAEAEESGTPSFGSSDHSESPTDLVPICPHGVMRWNQSKPDAIKAWAGYFCSEKIKEKQCRPNWYVNTSNGWKPQV